MLFNNKYQEVEKINKKDKFIFKAVKIHGDKFNYDNVNYINSTISINIRCNKHDNVFQQVPAEHLRGKMGCKECVGRITNTNDFITKAKETHNNKYDYSYSVYLDYKTKIIITCPIHGQFNQLPKNHTNGQGCPKCGRLKSNGFDTKDIFIEKCKLMHSDKYDYSLVDYVDSETMVKVICPIHGEFEQRPNSHVRGKGCNKCGVEKRVAANTHTKDVFINKAILVHGDKYDYNLVDYINSQTKVNIICPKHGEFKQLPYDHISGHGCVKCTSSVSSYEKEVGDFIISIGIAIKSSSMSIIPPNQLDIYLPSHKLAIEFDGLYWHSEEFIDKKYHLNKTELCEKQGIRLIHIFEDEWLYKQDIVKSRLMNILGMTTNKIHARKTKIKEVSAKESSTFLSTNHLQGPTSSIIRYGLYYGEELVSIMLFNKSRLGVGSRHDGYELTRFASKLDTNIIGGADKLLKHFIRTHQPTKIISYADRRWSQGELYIKLGFSVKNINKPNYWYIVGKNRKHRFNFRKDKLRDEGFDVIGKTEHEIMLNRGIHRIYDCGTIAFIKDCVV